MSDLLVPQPVAETQRLSRFLKDEGLSAETLFRAVDLIQQRTDVFLNDALAVSEEKAGFKSACAAGCGYCCHTMVSAVPPEVFYIAKHLEETLDAETLTETKERVITYAKRNRGKDGGDRYEAREACPFLRPEDWYCGLHTARPIVCRAMHSGSLKACQTAYDKRDSKTPAPTMAVFFKNSEAYFAAYVSALKPHGVKCYPVELAAALGIVWGEENSMQRWLGGEDLFADAWIQRVGGMVTDPDARPKEVS